MRIIRYQTQNEDPLKYGWLLDDRIGEIEGDPFGAHTGEWKPQHLSRT